MFKRSGYCEDFALGTIKEKLPNITPTCKNIQITLKVFDLISLPIFASSAYKVLKDRIEILSTMSFTYNININGPSIDPWGTPDITGSLVDMLP